MSITLLSALLHQSKHTECDCIAWRHGIWGAMMSGDGPSRRGLPVQAATETLQKGCSTLVRPT